MGPESITTAIMAPSFPFSVAEKIAYRYLGRSASRFGSLLGIADRLAEPGHSFDDVVDHVTGLLKRSLWLR